MGKVHFHCVYMYEENSVEKTAEYESPKQSHNIADPNVIAGILVNEIKKERGHTVKALMAIGKYPVGGEKAWQTVSEGK